MKSNFNNNWLIASETIFTESTKDSSKKKYYLICKIVPRGKISRNKVMYNWETVLRTKNQIPGLSLNHNHKFKNGKDIPRGEWIESYVKDNWLCGVAEVYDTEYNKPYIEWLKAAKQINVSLNVNGESEILHGQEGNYQEAKINHWKEISTVNAPGFLDAKSSLEIVLSESLKDEMNMQEKERKQSVDENELKKGIKIEMEHTKDPKIAEQIALDHLSEIKDYYTRLVKMEKEAGMEEADKTKEIKEEEVVEEAPEAVKEEEVNPAEEDEGEPLDSDYDYEQLKNGIIYELRITNSPYEAKNIAKKELSEDKDHYKTLLLEEEQNKEDSLYVARDKLDAISMRRYGRNYDSLLDREKGKVLFSTDIEKSINDDINSELNNHYLSKAVEENIDKIINGNTKELNSEEAFFEKLNEVRFFNKLKIIREE